MTHVLRDRPGRDCAPAIRPLPYRIVWRLGAWGGCHPLSGERLSVLLRDKPKLAGWEPMTPDKLSLMALEWGVAGDDNGLPWRVTEPWLSAVVVSPDGFVFQWHDDGTHLGVSDVRRLAGVDSSLSVMRGDWDEYSIVGNEVHGPGLRGTPARQAQVGNGTNPLPSDKNLVLVDSLADCGAAAAPPIGDAGSRVEGEFAPEAAEFVAQQFGVDVARIDWDKANKHRVISHSFSGSAPFDPVAACAALRLALATSRVQAAGPTTALPPEYLHAI